MVDTYCVTFRIADKTVAGKTGDDRRAALVENARAEDLGYWDEPTSFFLVQSSLRTPELAKKLIKGLSEKDDILFVFDPSDMSGNYFGPLKHADVLRSFFPKAAKIP